MENDFHIGDSVLINAKIMGKEVHEGVIYYELDVYDSADNLKQRVQGVSVEEIQKVF